MNPTLQHWITARNEGKRARDIAASLSLEEAQLVASAVGADGELHATRLQIDPTELLPKLVPLGPFKTITRNDTAVLEIEGSYADVEFFKAHGMGQSLGTIDLRLFTRHWQKAFWLEEQTKRGLRRSLQFFDAQGVAVHKAYLLPESHEAELLALVQALRADDQGTDETVEPAPAKEAAKADADIDVSGLHAAWSAMKDTHEFFGLLRKFGVQRTQALRLVGREFAEPLQTDVLGSVLEQASAKDMPIMIFVGNRGLIQIHTGPVKKIVTMDAWWNVLDPKTNLHVLRSGVVEAWLVRKPTVDGVVTAVELYDTQGEPVALLFGKRKPGTPEDPTWREVAEALPRA